MRSGPRRSGGPPLPWAEQSDRPQGGGEDEARLGELMRRSRRVEVLSATQVARIRESVDEARLARSGGGLARWWMALAAAGAAGLLLFALGRGPSTGGPAVVTEAPRAHEGPRRELVAAAGAWTRAEVGGARLALEGPGALLLPAADDPSAPSRWRLRRGRLLLRTGQRSVTLALGERRLEIGPAAMVEVVVERTTWAVAAYVGAARMRHAANVEPVTLTASHELRDGRLSRLDGVRRAEVETLLQPPPAEPPTASPTAPPSAPPAEVTTPSPEAELPRSPSPEPSALVKGPSAAQAPRRDASPGGAPPPVATRAPRPPAATALTPTAPTRTPGTTPSPPTAPPAPAPAESTVTVSPASPAAPAGAATAAGGTSPVAVPPAVVTPGGDGRLARETDLLAAAVRALRLQRAPRRALELLNEHGRLFPTGALRSEAALTRLDALLALGRRREALASLESLSLTGLGRAAELHLLRAELRAEAGHCARGLADFTAALAERSRLGHEATERALHGRAACRAQTGNQAGAREDLAEYLRRYPRGQFAASALRALADSEQRPREK